MLLKACRKCNNHFKCQFPSRSSTIQKFNFRNFNNFFHFFFAAFSILFLHNCSMFIVPLPCMSYGSISNLECTSVTYILRIKENVQQVHTWHVFFFSNLRTKALFNEKKKLICIAQHTFIQFVFKKAKSNLNTLV